MKNWSFLKQLFEEIIPKDEFDLDTQIRLYAEILVGKYKKLFPKLDYSLESLQEIDKIFEIAKEEYKNTIDHKKFIKSEKISSYILHTLKVNYKGDILWNNFEKQPVFIFDDYGYKEFHPYTYVKSRIIKGKEFDTLEFIETFCKKKI